jgi:hypothetical protein
MMRQCNQNHLCHQFQHPPQHQLQHHHHYHRSLPVKETHSQHHWSAAVHHILTTQQHHVLWLPRTCQRCGVIDGATTALWADILTNAALYFFSARATQAICDVGWWMRKTQLWNSFFRSIRAFVLHGCTSSTLMTSFHFNALRLYDPPADPLSMQLLCAMDLAHS